MFLANKIINLKLFEIGFTTCALQVFKGLRSPLFIEMELLFGSMVTKKVHFYKKPPLLLNFVQASSKLYVTWHPVIARRVFVTDSKQVQWVTNPVPKLSNRFPHWLLIDYKKKDWSASFGLDASQKPQVFNKLPLDTLSHTT